MARIRAPLGQAQRKREPVRSTPSIKHPNRIASDGGDSRPEASLPMQMHFPCLQALKSRNMNRPLKPHICLGLVLLVCGKSYADRHEPRFVTMASQYQRVEKQEPVLRFAGRDKGLKHTLFLLSDRADRPLLFYADITTPVCSDNLCKPVTIGLYWDLVGNYVGYGVPAGCPLTKYDDVLFEPADYMKLHQVLMDRQSILGRTTMADMFDPNAPTDARNLTARGQGVDGVSGATSKAFRQSIVPGALYSCHTV
jgi:hypothetical protein